MPYTYIQYFFWLFSGVEISLLKQCPGDYNRQAGIGFTIFMTCFFAALAGGFAAYRFSEGNWIATIVFGIVWGLLIFSIDRSMVVTLKKDPTKTNQKFWEPFLTRLILAGLLAFMISIPLEIEIFKGVINIQLKEDVQNAISKYGSNVEKSTGIAGVAAEQRRQEEIKNAAAANAIAANNSIPGWRSINEEAVMYSKSEANASQSAYKARKVKEQALAKTFKRSFNAETEQYFTYQVRRGREWEKYIGAINTEKRFVKESQEWKIKKDKKNKEAEELAKRYRAEQAIAASEASINEKKEAARRARLQAVIDSTKIEYEGAQQDLGFVRQYVAMENAAKADSGVLFFLWVIRILFFTIEILPTIVKLKTPLGDYDRMLHHHEATFALKLQSNLDILRQKEIVRHDNELAIATQVEKERYNQEIELNKKTLTDIADRQQDLAKRILKDWHRQERLKLTQTKVEVATATANTNIDGSMHAIAAPPQPETKSDLQTMNEGIVINLPHQVSPPDLNNPKEKIISKLWQVQNSRYIEYYLFQGGSEKDMILQRKVDNNITDTGIWGFDSQDPSLINITLKGEEIKYKISALTNYRMELVCTKGIRNLQLELKS